MYHIQERSFLKIILCCSLFISVKAFAEGPVGHFERVEVYDDGRYKGIRGINKSTPYKHGRVWQGVFDSHTGQYASFDGQDLRVRHARTGLTSSSKISTTIESRVSKSTVFRNLLSRARLGGKYAVQRAAGKLGAGLLGGPAGWAITAALTAYDLAAPHAASEGYYYDEKYEDFVKPVTYVYCVASSGVCTDQRVQETVMNPKAVYADMGPNPSDAEINKKLCSKLDVQHFGFEYPDRFSKKDAKFNARKDTCEVEFNVLKEVGFLSPGKTTTSETRVMERVPKVKEPIPQSVFDKAVQPSADASPSKYVNATANQDGSVPGESQGNPTVPNGTVVTLGPATGPDNKPVQVTINFRTGSDGNTSADVKVTPRPDLTPGSPAAPNYTPAPVPPPATTPTTTPGDNGKPDGQPNKTPDDNPKDNPKPDPDDSPSGKDKPKPDDKPDPDGKDYPKKDERPKEDDKPKEDGGLLCKVFPNILACDELPEKEEPNLEIPQETIDLNFTPDNTFSEYGECPAPVTFQALGAEYKISLEPACNLAAMMRPFIIAMAWLVASFFVARVVRNNA
ncbi:IgG-binding virulence factor TspB family protein [Neisseria sp. DTU_2020_1000833_1_SI_GRL_NUU_006]|nr:IgG-binding virulence factor TspB family protein [Neisseria sp. DTU_2020_1000833_1_SI_GRL_NUU_006]WNU97946.1 IgG-binding virulence factor TspB family protein [Neisseria sp. DTU_2020_1000833_1_SI_GRL_NUU_006]